MRITYKMIAKYIDRKEETIKYMAKNNPKQLELLKLGLKKKLEEEEKLKESLKDIKDKWCEKSQMKYQN